MMTGMMTRENPATGIGNLIALALAVLLSLLMLPDQAGGVAPVIR